ncbi:MAG: hypothetical protein ACXWJW_06830, partial [Xanthobacteraceae bacterium]
LSVTHSASREIGTHTSVEIGPRAAPAFGAQSVRVELALDGLMRGELRAAALTLTGPEFAVTLDRNGRFVSQLRNLGFDPDRVSIDRLAITVGRLLLEDGASGTRVMLDKLGFGGEVRPQSGQVKGDGAFTASGQTYRYQITTGRRDAATRIRFNLEPADRPLTFETEGTLTFEKDLPKFEGTASLVRPAGVVLASGKTAAGEPWRISGRVKADAASALFDQVEAQYGPDDRRLHLGGTAEFKFGAQPRFESILSARQIDLDRALAAAGNTGQLPALALSGLLDLAGDVARPPFPVKLGVGVDAVTLGGSTVQAMRADIASTKDGWSIDTLEFRAPGATQVRLSGRVSGAAATAEFSGPVAVDSTDPAVLMAWLEGADRPRGTIGALRFNSDVTVNGARVAFERVNADIDRKPLEGRLVYTYPAGSQRARLDVAVKAADLDVESAYGMINTLLAGSKIERPGEIALALDLGRATFAGFTATSANANLRLNGAGLRIEKLAIADFGGAALNGSGEIDIASAQPHGSIALNLAAPKLDGVAAVVEKFWPGRSGVLTRNVARLAPARVDATLKVDPQSGSGGGVAAQLSLKGQLGSMQLAIAGEGAGNIAAPSKSDVKFDVRVNSEDATLVSVLGLDSLAPVPAQRRPASLVASVSGALGGDMRVDAKLASDGFDLSGAGTLKFADSTLVGEVSTSLASADMRVMRRQNGPAFPVALKSNVKIAGNTFKFSGLVGKAGGAAVQGDLSLAVREPTGAASGQSFDVDGKLVVDTLDVSATLAAILGAPATVNAAQTVSWPAQPFAATIFSDLRGRVEIDAARADLLPSIAAQKLHGVVGFGPTEISFDNFSASIGGGSARAQGRFERGAAGLTLRGSATLANADATAVIRSDGQTPIAGRVSGQLSFEGTGTSPSALIAGLRGIGTLALENGKIAGLDRGAVDAATRATDRGNAIAPQRLAEVVSRALDAGALILPSANAPIELTNGRARLGKLVMPNVDDPTIAASLDLVEESLDARVTLFGSRAVDVQGLRPELVVLYKGPVSAPRRTVDVSSLTSWLTLQSVERESRKLEAEEREAKKREQFEALMRDNARERQGALEPANAPPVTGTTPPPAVNAAVPPARAPAAATGLFAPVFPAPQLIPEQKQPAGASLTAPTLPSPIVVPRAVSPASTAVPTERVQPAQSAMSPPSSAETEALLPNPETLPVNPPLPQRRPTTTASPAPPADLAPRVPRAGYGNIQQHNAPQ